MNPCELEIGMPEEGQRRICSAIVMHEGGYQDYLSHNDESYWCSMDEYGIDIKIGKQSHYGIELTKLVKARKPVGEIKHLLLKVALENMQPVHFVDIIRQTKEDSTRDGRNYVREQLAGILSPE